MVQEFERKDIGKIFAMSKPALNAENEAKLNRCLLMSASLSAGFVDEDLVCIWGLIPPTLLSERAYIWLYTTPALEGNEFVFVRNSQRIIAKALEHFPSIHGHVHANNTQARKWIKWLGASFKEREGDLIPFVIRKKLHG
jgi:hypothetical protein